MGIRKTAIRENAKKWEDENHTVEKLTPQGEQLACRYLDRWVSNHPASRLQTPHGCLG